MDNLIGQTLGNYQIEALIGTGGMGQVFRAVHRHLGRPAAIKVLHANLAADQGFQARFLQEARAVASLKHPNIVEVYDFGEQAGNFYLVMELIDGGSLRQLLSQIMAQAGLPLWTGLDMVRQTADGLALAHARGMVHRDIKPDNLLLSNSVDGNQLVKITDFGLVRLAESGAMTVVGSVLGTAAYLSPEQCQGLELDGRSDIYSLGVVLYEVATGYVPFQAKTLSAAAYHHVQVAPPPPRTIRPDLPLELEKIIMRCLAKRPEERYSSAAELSSVLRTVVVGANQATIKPHYVRAPEPVADNPAITVVQQKSRREPQLPPPSLDLDSALTTAPGAPRIRLHDQTGKVLQRVELTPDGITIGRTPDNNLCYESADLSRNHLRINLEGQRVTVTDLGSSNGTYLEGIRLLPQVAQVWEGSEPLRLGSLWLALEPASALNQSVAVASRPSRSNQIGVALDSKAITLIPGQPAKCKVSLVNLEEIVDHISLEVVGVPAQWVEGTASEVQLNPGTQATVLLTIMVPRESTSRAGDYQVTIRARSRENPGEPGAAEATWTVLPFAAMSVKTTPAKAGGRREAAYKVTLRNEGNAPARYVLSGQDDEEKLVFLFEASSSKSLSQITVDVAPGDAPMIKLRVGAGRRWFGKAEAQGFSVQVAPENNKDAQLSAARFMHQPLIPTWVMVVAPFVLIGLVLLLSASGSDLTLFALVVLALFVVVFVLIILRLPDIAVADYQRAWAIHLQPGDAFQKQGPPALDTGRLNAAPLAPAMSTGEPAAPAAGPPSVGHDFYALLLSDPTPDARQAVQIIESLRMTVRPRLSAYLGRIIFLLLGLPIVAIVLFPVILVAGVIPPGDAGLAVIPTCIFVTFAGLWLISPRMAVRSSLPYFGRFLILLLLAPIIGFGLALILWTIMSSDVNSIFWALTWIVPSLFLILFIIRVKTTLITIDQGRLEIATGVLSKNVSNIELHRIVDLSLHRTILNRLTGDGSLILTVEQWRKPPQQVVLRGLAKRDRLDTVYSNLRNLVQILRSENRGKGRVE